MFGPLAAVPIALPCPFPYARHVGYTRVSNWTVTRSVRLLVLALIGLGVVLMLTAGRATAQPGGTAQAARATGYAYSKAPAGETAALLPAGVTRDDSGSPARPFIIGGIAVVVFGGAVFEGMYVRRRIDRPR
jgi:hypothetical protein